MEKSQHNLLAPESAKVEILTLIPPALILLKFAHIQMIVGSGRGYSDKMNSLHGLGCLYNSKLIDVKHLQLMGVVKVGNN